MAKDLPVPAVIYSTFSPRALAESVLRQYSLGEVLSCELFLRGINDTYRLECTGGRFALRVYRQDWRSLNEVAFELDTLLHLFAHDVPLAAPIPRTDGRFVSELGSCFSTVTNSFRLGEAGRRGGRLTCSCD